MNKEENYLGYMICARHKDVIIGGGLSFLMVSLTGLLFWLGFHYEQLPCLFMAGLWSLPSLFVTVLSIVEAASGWETRCHYEDSSPILYFIDKVIFWWD